MTQRHNRHMAIAVYISVMAVTDNITLLGGKSHFLPPANEDCEGYVFTGVCLSTEGGFGLCPGGLCPGGSLSKGVPIRETPRTEIHPYGNERPVRILLECFTTFISSFIC